MKNLLFAAYNYPPKIGGPATSVPKIAEYLSGKGYGIDIVALDYPGIKDEKRENIEVHRFKHLSKNPADNSFPEILSSAFQMSGKIRLLVREKNPIAVHCHDISVSPFAAIFAKKATGFKAPIVAKYTRDIAVEYSLMEGNTAPEKILDENGGKKAGLPDLKLKFLEFIQNYVVNNSDYIACPSYFQKKQLMARGIKSSKLVLLRNGIDTGLFRPIDAKRNDGKFRLLYYGRLVKWKGLDYLLAAAKELAHGIKEI